MFAGSAQLVAVELLDEGAAAPLIIATIVMINARHTVYSAVVNSRIGDVPGWNAPLRTAGSGWHSATEDPYWNMTKRRD